MRTDKVRVLFVSPFPPPPAGVSNVTAAWFESDLAAWFDLSLCDITRRYVSQAQRSNFALVNLIDGFKNWIKFIRICITLRPEIVNVVYTSRFAVLKASGFAFLGKLLGARVVGHLHGGRFDDFYHSLTQWQKKMVRAGMKIPDHWIAPGSKWRELLAECEIPVERITVCHNPVRLDVFAYAAHLQYTDPIIDDKSRRLKVLFVGSISRRKGLDDMLQVARWAERDELPVHFTFMGGEEWGEERDDIICNFGDQISPEVYTFLHPVESKDYFKIMGDCDIFWLPSRNENLPMALLDAVTLGRPAIATRVGSIPEVFTDGENGYLVAPSETEQLYQVLKKMVENPSLRNRFSQTNFRVARDRFHPNVLAGYLADVYRSLITGVSCSQDLQ
jgi:glycosyltransferase involved in cell wall biosynthesis